VIFWFFETRQQLTIALKSNRAPKNASVADRSARNEYDRAICDREYSFAQDDYRHSSA
jgi:hypothetical protein